LEITGGGRKHACISFGVRNFDMEAALKFIVQAATRTEDDRERPFIKEDLTLGYVPADKDRIAVSRTLKYASDDFAIAQFARRWMVFHAGGDCDCIVSTLQMTVGDRDVLTTVEVEAPISRRI
jgi:hypothetical protein